MSFDRQMLPEPPGYFESQGLRLTGHGKWRTTNCAFHGGSDSMRVNVKEGHWCCMNCGAKGGDVLAYHMQIHGLDFVQSAKALGAWIEDGKSNSTPSPAPLPARAALQVLAFEATLAATAAGNLACGHQLTDSDRSRLRVAAARIAFISESYS